MTIGILKEPTGERRVSMLPEGALTLINKNVTVLVEKDAGKEAFAKDSDYQAIGAEVCDKNTIISKSDLLLSINPPNEDEISLLKEGQILFCVLNPYFNLNLVKALNQKGVTVFSMDIVPRTTRAQSMDILSSMATVSGYKAVLKAAGIFPKFFPMFMTAAGTIKPANMLILGAGVAGLQSIATARKLGAVVHVFDVRAAVKEEVVGLGGKFVEVEGATDDKSAGGYAVEQTEEYKKKQGEAIHQQAIKSDIIICTAQIPGKNAPVLIKKETVDAMKPGSVIIDLAASTGGNCELTQNDKTIVYNEVTIVGESNFPNQMPIDASKMYGQNINNFLKLIIDKDGNLNLNFEDDIVKGTCVSHNKDIINERIKSLI